MLARIAALVLAVVAAACGTIVPGERPPLGVSNGTDLVVTVIVNGNPVGVFAPDAGSLIDPNLLPPLPWAVEARTASGRVLTSMTVEPGLVFRETMADGSVHISGALGRVDLSCGRFDMWAGESIGGPAPGPGAPGDCVP